MRTCSGVHVCDPSSPLAEALRFGHNESVTERLALALLAVEDDGPIAALGIDADSAEAHRAEPHSVSASRN